MLQFIWEKRSYKIERVLPLYCKKYIVQIPAIGAHIYNKIPEISKVIARNKMYRIVTQIAHTVTVEKIFYGKEKFF